MPTKKFPAPPIPRHRIPKAMMVCIDCGSTARSRSSYGIADGYVRYMECTNSDCQCRFWSLTPYPYAQYKTNAERLTAPNEHKPKTMRYMPSDRALTADELAERSKWAEEADNAAEHSDVYAKLRDYDPHFEALAKAIAKSPDARTDGEAFMVEVIETAYRQYRTMQLAHIEKDISE
jgi:hypothetical protein